VSGVSAGHRLTRRINQLEIRRPLHSEMEEVVVATDRESGLKAVIAIHSTLLGPAICGVRLHPYSGQHDALEDAARTARLATHRAALAQIPFGGACAAIAAVDDRHDRVALMRAFGTVIQQFEGRLIAAEDLGCSMQDMDTIKSVTPFACGGSNGSVGDPAYYTSLGVLRAIEACVRHQFGTDSLDGLKIGVYGVGNVGFQLCEMLNMARARLFVCDIQTPLARRAAEELNATLLTPAEMLTAELDILCPCAVGRILDDHSISKLRCAIVAGSSNNQLVKPNRHGRMLYEHGIVYAPDFAVNAGGLYANACEIMDYGAPHATILVNGIHDTLETLLDQSRAQQRPTTDLAMAHVHDRLRRARAERIMAYV
jgi:leucine dehydrogenase